MANFNFNKVILGGRLTAEPELKQTQGGHSVVSFNVAVNRRTKPGEEQKSDFFSVVAWRTTADFVARYFHKGSSICIVGTLQNSNWTDQNNQKHYRTDIVADEVMFVDSKGESNNSAQGQAVPATPNWTEVPTDGDLPF